MLERLLRSLAPRSNKRGRWDLFFVIWIGSWLPSIRETLAFMQRRLAAIVVADLSGYSRLIRENEDRTITEFRALIDDLFASALKANGGRIVKMMGDGVLAEFASVVSATDCAAHIQTQMAVRNANGPKNEQMWFRIGINLGDIVADGEDIHGDGVNVAARLETVAPIGGIAAISSAVHDQVFNRLEMIFEDQGAQHLKNIDAPVPIWTWSPSAARVARSSSRETLKPSEPLDTRPSIAVLPFENMSDDPDQDYFADGIADDIITALSRSKWLFVVARSSSFTYRGRQPDLRRVALELGVRFLLQGTVRKAGSRLRITAQLIRGPDQQQVWAEKYDGSLDDIFDLQDEITRTVVSSLLERIRVDDVLPAERQDRREDLRDWDLVRRIWKPFWKLSPDSLEQARKLAEKALAENARNSEALWALAAINSISSTWVIAPTRIARSCTDACRTSAAVSRWRKRMSSRIGRRV